MSPKVLILSLPRTGTQSIADALVQLGYNQIYHMREVRKNKHQGKWSALLDTKYGDHARDLTRADFDDILGDYDGLADFPASIFATELIAAYPEARIIMTVRDEDDWVRSMQSTLVHAHTHADADRENPMWPMRERYHRYCWGDDFEAHGREYALEFQRSVRETAKKLLEYNVKEGWGPLCAFLGHEIPEAPFPKTDDVARYRWTVPGKNGGQV